MNDKDPGFSRTAESVATSADSVVERAAGVARELTEIPLVDMSPEERVIIQKEMGDEALDDTGIKDPEEESEVNENDTTEQEARVVGVKQQYEQIISTTIDHLRDDSNHSLAKIKDGLHESSRTTTQAMNSLQYEAGQRLDAVVQAMASGGLEPHRLVAELHEITEAVVVAKRSLQTTETILDDVVRDTSRTEETAVNASGELERLDTAAKSELHAIGQPEEVDSLDTTASTEKQQQFIGVAEELKSVTQVVKELMPRLEKSTMDITRLMHEVEECQSQVQSGMDVPVDTLIQLKNMVETIVNESMNSPLTVPTAVVEELEKIRL